MAAAAGDGGDLLTIPCWVEKSARKFLPMEYILDAEERDARLLDYLISDRPENLCRLGPDSEFIFCHVSKKDSDMHSFVWKTRDYDSEKWEPLGLRWNLGGKFDHYDFYTITEMKCMKLKLSFPRFVKDGKINGWIYWFDNGNYQFTEEEGETFSVVQLSKLLKHASKYDNPKIRERAYLLLDIVTRHQDRCVVSSAPHHNGVSYHLTITLHVPSGSLHIDLERVKGGTDRPGNKPLKWRGKLLMVTDISTKEGSASTATLSAIDKECK